MKIVSMRSVMIVLMLVSGMIVLAHTLPPLWENGGGATIHYQPVAWPSEPASPLLCGDQCGDWKPYTRFNNSINDPRVQDPSNGGTAPQNYVNVSSSCTDKQQPSIYYYLHRGASPADDVVMFRWRVEQAAHNYATGPNAGNYSSSSPWSSALWTVLFDIDGSGYRSLAAHLNGSTGSPGAPIDTLAGIWGNVPTQSIDYNDPNIHLLGHNPTAFIGPTGKLLNFHSSLTPNETWANGANETVWDYGTTRATRVTNSPCTEFFIDYQIPVAMLDASSVNGPKITRDTPISMLFCTANSLNNPFQKDCAINRKWGAGPGAPAPFGDYISFNKEASYQQPIVSAVTAEAPSSCPGTYKLAAKVQDALALQGGVVKTSVQAVDFFYWYDRNGDGEATSADTGSAWTKITPTAALTLNTLNTWTANWDASPLAKGKYLIGVQAIDDADALDDGMLSTGVDNRTFSYLSGDVDNVIYKDNVWGSGQQASFPAHASAQTPSAEENWYGNPSVTGNQVAVIGTAINTCGIAPSIALARSPGSVGAGGVVSFTMSVSNPSSSNALAIASLEQTLPPGFAYVGSSSSGTNGISASDPAIDGQTLTWTLSPAVSLPSGSSATLSFNATAAGIAGTYTTSASAATSFGQLASAPVAIGVDSARLSLAIAPSSYSVPADGATPLTFTLRYANDSAVSVTSAAISNTLPVGATYVSCAGGLSCSLAGGTVSFSLGTLSAGAAGSVSFTLTVPNSWSASSLVDSATLNATAPDASPVSASASTTVAVTGLAGSGQASMALTKSASATNVAPGGTVTYTLAYANQGTVAATNVVLSDTLPAGMSTTSGNCSGCSLASGVASWNIGTVAAGASGSRTITVTAASPFTAANPTNNIAEMTWTDGGPITASADVGVTGQACSTYYFKNASINIAGTPYRTATLTAPSSAVASSIAASATSAGFTEFARFYQDPVTANTVSFGASGTLTTRFYVTKGNGPQLRVHGLVYDYDPVGNTETLLGQTSTYFENTGSSTNQLFTFSIPVSNALQKGHRLLWRFTASSNSSINFNYLFDGINSPTHAEFCVTPPVTLSLDTSVNDVLIDAATTPTLTYTLKYANTGGTQATNVNLVNTLPAGFTNCEASSDGTNWYACSGAGASPPTHTLTLPTLNAGASGQIYVRGVVPAGTTGGDSLVNTTTIVSEQTVQLSKTARTDVLGTNVGGTAALAIALSANRTSASPGQSVTYTIDLVNVGDGTATNVAVTNVLPAQAYYTYGSCSGCSAAGGTLTWPSAGTLTLTPGASQTFVYSMLVGTSGLPAGVTVISDDATATASGGINVTSNIAAVTLSGNPVLAGSLVAAPASGLLPGDLVTYILTIENTGAALASGALAKVGVPGSTSYAGDLTASRGTGGFDPVENAVIFNIGDLASGASAVLTFKARVSSPLNSGTTVLTNSADVSAANAVPLHLSASATASAAPVLFVTLNGPSAVPYPSAVLTAAASGTTLFLSRTDTLQLDQLVSIGGTVARIIGLAAKSIQLDTVVNAASGTPVYGAVEFSIAYRNEGNAPAEAAQLQHALPAGFGYYAAAPDATASPISGNSGEVSWSLGTIAPAQGGTLSIVTFPRGVTGVFTSTATLQAPNASPASATLDTAIGGLSVTKTTATPVVSAGAEAEYTILVTNSLASGAIVDIGDVLPQGFTYVANSATVAGSASEPSFAAEDEHHVHPRWDNVLVPANGAIAITFKAQVAPNAGAAAYQNEVELNVATLGVGVTTFDPLQTTAEDVTVLGAGSGVLQGYVFERDDHTSSPFDAARDRPLAGVRVEIHKASFDCAAGTNCFVLYTDSNGYFERVVAAEDWIVSVIEGSGALGTGLTQVAGTNDNQVSVPDQGVVQDHNGYTSSSPTTHLVSTAPGANGSIDPATRTVNDGETTTFTVTPDTGYVIADVSGCDGTLASTTYTTGAITAACTVTATFAAAGGGGPSSYTIAASASPLSGGTIVGAGVYASGQAIGLVASAAVGYVFSHWSEGGVLVSSAATYNVTVSANRTFVANFIAAQHTVTSSAGVGGSIGPANALVVHGATTSFTIAAHSGYSVASIVGCGGALSGTTYTTAAITGDCAVIATFAKNTYPVTAIANVGGSISPAITNVAHGSTATFTVTPASGYRLGGVNGCSGALSSNSYTTAPVTASCTVSASFVSLGPTIETPPPADVFARGLFTDIPLALAPKATAADGTPLEVKLVDPRKLRPGHHILVWRAVDAAGREVTAEQVLNVWPTVSLGQDLLLGFGARGAFDVILNGDSPVYPFTVEFAVSGDGGFGTKHTLGSGSVTFMTGTEAVVEFDTLAQTTSFPDHHLRVELDKTLNVAERGHLDIRITSANVAPRAEIRVLQQDRLSNVVARDAGIVTLQTLLTDANTGDTHTLQWTTPTGLAASFTSDARNVTFAAESLSLGLHQFSVVATDSGVPPLSTRAKTNLIVRAASPALGEGDANGNGVPDSVEGWGDSGNGIPAYLNRISERHVLPEDAPVVDSYLVEGDTGVRMRLGAYAQYQGSGARLTSGTIAALAKMDDVQNVGGYFNYQAYDLAQPGQQVRSVIPQRAAIPQKPVYRLWDPESSRWTTFVENETNRLASAPGEPGFCPPPGSAEYRPGLIPGYWCVQVTMDDGGANDMDRQINGMMEKLGGVGVKESSVVTGTSSGSGGGGAMNGAILLLALLGFVRRARRIGERALCAALFGTLAATSVSAQANEARVHGRDCEQTPDEADCREGWYLGAAALSVRNSVDAAQMDARLARAGYDTQTRLSGQTRWGGAVFGGYRWRYLGFEGGYTDLRRMTTRVEGDTPISEDYLDAISRAHPRSGSGPQLSILGYLPLGERFDAYGRLGTLYWKGEKTADARVESAEVDARAADPIFGVGLNYRMSTRWFLSVELDQYRLDGERLNVAGAHIRYRISPRDRD